MTDQELIQRILDGNREAFRQLVERYGNMIYQAAYSVIRHSKDAEDIAQEAMLQIYTSLPKFQGRGLKTWMFRIAVNKAIDHQRKLGRRKEQLIDNLELMEPQSSEPSLEATVLRTERKKHIRRRIDQLPPNFRTVVYRHYIEEQTFQQIATELELKPKSVESRLHRARKWMRKHWKEEYDDTLR